MLLRDESGDRNLHPHKMFPSPVGITSKDFNNVRDIAIKSNAEQLKAIISYLKSEVERRQIYEEIKDDI